MHKRFSDGFTIVELLVVITVIAILAGISIVSYTSVVSDAKTTMAVQEISQLKKAVSMYYGKYRTLPNNSTYLAICLSKNTTACAQNYQGNTPMTNAVLTELKKVGYSKLPELDAYAKTYTYGPGLQYTLAAPYLALSVASSGLDTSSGLLVLPGDKACPIGTRQNDASIYPTPATQGATTCYFTN